MAGRKIAIVGTAETWSDAPFGDTTWDIWSLNDAYRLGTPRATIWFDLHPPDEWLLVPEGQHTVKAWEMPQNKRYPRPAGHPKWIAGLTIPIYVQQAQADWPTSRTFPRKAIEDWVRPMLPVRTDGKQPMYMASSPAWMVALALLPQEKGGFGFGPGDTIGIWGIHLATEFEYVQQRPQMEMLVGMAGAMGVRVVLPPDAPICQNQYLYAYEHKPDFGSASVGAEVQQLTAERNRLMDWYRKGGKGPFKVKLHIPDAPLKPKQRLPYIEACLQEASQRLQAIQMRERGMAA